MADNFTINDDVDEFPNADNPNNQPPNMPPPPSNPQHNVQQSILQAVEAHFIAKKTRAIANINPYMTSPVGVAEHSDVVEEVIRLLSDIDQADGMIETLKRISNQS